MTIETTCPICHKVHPVEVDQKGYELWMGGELIQRALPALSTSQRELLITGICDPCSEYAFGFEEEDG
jgi:hypothetical protein